MSPARPGRSGARSSAARLPAEAAEHDLAAGEVQTRLGRPEMRSPSASSGSASARMSSGDRLQQAEADHRRSDPRLSITSGLRAARRRDRRRCSAARAARRSRRRRASPGAPVVDRHAALGAQARDRQVLQLAAVGRLGETLRGGCRAPLPAASDGGTDSRRNIETAASSGARRRMAAAVLEMAALAAPRVVERPEAVRAVVEDGAVTQSAEEAVADLEVGSRSN